MRASVARGFVGKEAPGCEMQGFDVLSGAGAGAPLHALARQSSVRRFRLTAFGVLPPDAAFSSAGLVWPDAFCSANGAGSLACG